MLLEYKNGANLLASLANCEVWENWQNKKKPVKQLFNNSH